MDRAEASERLLEISEEMHVLLGEAMRIVRQCATDTERDRAKGSWYAQIAMALNEDHEFVGSSLCTMEDTARELESDDNGDDPTEEEDDEL